MTEETANLSRRLTRIRAQIQQLSQQEAALAEALTLTSAVQPPQPRPGWPIQRLVSETAGISLH